MSLCTRDTDRSPLSLTARGALCLHTELHVPAVSPTIACTRRTSRPPGTRIGFPAMRWDSVYPLRAPQWRARVMLLKRRPKTSSWHLRAALLTSFVNSADLKWLNTTKRNPYLWEENDKNVVCVQCSMTAQLSFKVRQR